MLLAAEEEIAPALRDHWQDVCAAFHDEDAHHLYVRPETIAEQLESRATIRLSSLSSGQPFEFRAQSADTAARSIADAEPELEKLVRSGYRTVVTWPRRGEGERAAYNLARLRAVWQDGGAGAADAPDVVRFAQTSLREGFIAPSFRLAVIPEHRLLRRRRAERPVATGRPPRRPALVRRPAHGRHRRPRGPRDRPLRRLRDQDRRGRHPRLPLPRVPGLRPRLRPLGPAREDLALRRRRRRAPAALEARAAAAGTP